MKKYLVNAVEFDFDGTELEQSHQKFIIKDVTGVWDAIDDEELVDSITDHYGFCIKSIDYQEQS